MQRHGAVVSGDERREESQQVIHVINRHIQHRYHIMGVLTSVYMNSTVEFTRTLDTWQQFGIADGVCIAHHLGQQVHHPEIPVHAPVRCGFHGIGISRCLNGNGIK